MIALGPFHRLLAYFPTEGVHACLSKLYIWESPRKGPGSPILKLSSPKTGVPPYPAPFYIGLSVDIM
jgi:hypothetical protein